MDKNNIKFIFKLLDKKVIITCFLIECFLDFIYYFIPFSFTFYLTSPFTIQKAVFVCAIFIISKSVRTFLIYIYRKKLDNYLYSYSNKQYTEYYKKLTTIPVEELSKYQTGYLERIIEKISELVYKVLSAEYLSIILGFAFFFYTAFKQSILIGTIAIILSTGCVIFSIYILKKSNKTVEELYEEESEYSSIYQDYISNIRTVRALNNFSFFENRIGDEGRQCYNKYKKYVKYYTAEELIRNILMLAPFVFALIKAIMDLSNGIDTLGVIAFYITIYLEMGFIFEELSNTIVSWFELKAIKKTVIKLFRDSDNRKEVKKFNSILLKDIIINHKETAFNINIPDMIINKNDKICVTGKSGQGKTSLLNLIIGNISCKKGIMKIDNFDMRKYKLDIGVVSQEIELFNMSIKDNLCLDKNIDDDTIISLLKELDLNEILMFDNGIYTIVGEKGLKLSSGQKRRINILRSYFMNKKIYILDEPTSNLDYHTEKLVVDFIIKYFKDKTLIISTHNKKIKSICNKFYGFHNHTLKDLEE